MNKYIKQLITLPSIVKFFLITEVILGFGMGIWNLNLNFFLSSRGMEPTDIGRIVSLGSLSTAIFAIFCGFFCDRVGYKNSMISGCVLKAGAMLLTLITTPGPMLCFARVLNGLGDCLIMVCIYPYITSMVSDKLKNTVYNLLFSVAMLSLFLGNFAAGELALKIKSYYTVILIGTIIVGTAAALRCLLPAIRKKDIRRFKLSLPKSRFIKLYLLYEFLGYCCYFLAYSMMNLICRDFIKLSDGLTGVAMGTMTLTSGIGIFVVPVIVDKFGRLKANTSAMVLLCILYIAMAFISGHIYLLLVIITAMMQCMMAGFIDGPVLSSVADEEKGSFSGFRLVFVNVGSSVGIFVAGYMIGMEQGITVLYLTACFLTGLQIILFVFGFKRAIPE